jgi:tetratricopeptide (TPR) repeat protein
MTPFLMTPGQRGHEWATLRRTTLAAALRDTDSQMAGSGMQTNARSIRDNHSLFAEYHQVAEYYLSSLELYRDTGNQRGEAMAHYSLAAIAEFQESYGNALDHAERANILDSLGYAEHHLGNFAEATACYERAISIFREIGEPDHEATVLTHLGDAHHDAGRPPLARKAWRQALTILEGLGHRDAENVRSKLAGVGD